MDKDERELLKIENNKLLKNRIRGFLINHHKNLISTDDAEKGIKSAIIKHFKANDKK